MKIENIKINAYGNLENKEIELKDGINIIHGLNESGKSTVLNYIVNSFYGISKKKEGREISDYEKFKPWNNQEFSGRIKYVLDDGKTYEILRDFNKRDTKIYNEKLEDITKQFEIDKKEGSKIFIEQTGVDKQMYLSTVVSMQQEVRLEETDQNILVQKIANLAGTGDDNVFYKKALNKLQEKIKNEIGTNKTSQKPINIIEKNIEEINNRIKQIEPYQNKKYEIDEEKEKITEQLKEIQIQKEILQKIQEQINLQNDYQKEIEIKENNNKKNENKISELNYEKSNLDKKVEIIQKEIKEIKNKIQEQEEQSNIIQNKIQGQELNSGKVNIEAKKSNKKTIIEIIIGMTLFVATLISIIVIKNYYVTTGLAIALIVNTIISIINIKKEKKYKQKEQNIIQKQVRENLETTAELNNNLENIRMEIKEQKNKLEKLIEDEKEEVNEVSMIKGQIILLQKEIKDSHEYINTINNKLKDSVKKEQEKILEQYKIVIDRNNIEEILKVENKHQELRRIEEQINNQKIKLKTLEVEENTILPQIDSLVNLEENLENEKEKYKDLKEQEETINITINNLEKAYEEMKNTITPKFTQNLSESIEKITNKKYNKVTINDEHGLIVENSRGEYIQANKLSTGTVDQLYLALRLSMINDLSKETLPIILDETFAYFDTKRLENMLKYMSNELNKHQTIIFTCTKREKEIMDKLNINYNYIEL